MSFWEDLEEMQKEIENLDTHTTTKQSTRRSSACSADLRRETRSSRLKVLEQKAQKLSKIITKESKIVTSPNHLNMQRNVDLCVKDVTMSHDANVQLMHHLGALEEELRKLTQKEDVWQQTTKVIQNEVSSLRKQIHKMKDQRSDSVSLSAKNGARMATKTTENVRKYEAYHQNSNQTNVRKQQFQSTQRVDRTERIQRNERAADYDHQTRKQTRPNNIQRTKDINQRGFNGSDVDRKGYQPQRLPSEHGSEVSYRDYATMKPQNQQFMNTRTDIKETKTELLQMNTRQQTGPNNIQRTKDINQGGFNGANRGGFTNRGGLNGRDVDRKGYQPQMLPSEHGSEVSYRDYATMKPQNQQFMNTRTDVKETKTEFNSNYQNKTANDEVNVYKYKRIERENEQIIRENDILKENLAKYSEKFSTDTQKLKLRMNEKSTQILNLKHNLENKEYALRDEQNRVTDLRQQITVLQTIVEDYDNLKTADSKLQLEYQRSLHDVLEARKEKSLVAQQLNAANNHIQELEINCRQINHEKMGALSEMRAMKQVFERERKNVSERYERIVQKLEAELSYAKKMYQEMKRKYRELSHRFESDQPQYEQLKHAIEEERDGFQLKLNDVVIAHVSKLDMISKQSKVAVQNAKWIENVAHNEERLQNNEVIMDNQMSESASSQQKSIERKMNSIWEPK